MTTLELLAPCMCHAGINLNTGRYVGLVDNLMSGDNAIEWETALSYKTEGEAIAAARRLLDEARRLATRSAEVTNG